MTIMNIENIGNNMAVFGCMNFNRTCTIFIDFASACKNNKLLHYHITLNKRSEHLLNFRSLRGSGSFIRGGV